MAYEYEGISASEARGWDSIEHYDVRLADDWVVQEAHHTMFGDDIAGDHRAMVIDMLHDYLEREYGYEFDDFYDWEAFREWYDS